MELGVYANDPQCGSLPILYLLNIYQLEKYNWMS